MKHTNLVTELNSPVLFQKGNREWHVYLNDNHELVITITGRRNGKMLIVPNSNTSCAIRTELDGPTKLIGKGKRPTSDMDSGA